MCATARVVPLVFIFLIVPAVLKSFPLEDEGNSLEDRTPIADLSHMGESIFREPSPETGEKLESWKENSPENPEEFGSEYAEGDIVFPPKSRNGLVGEAYRWKNGVIPYEISGAYPSNDLNVILRAMDIYKKYTCVSFKPRLPTDKDYLVILNGRTGCWSSVGRLGGRQELNLQSPSCTTKVGTPMHELMHAAGFLHEQNRNERDEYVTIAWNNIKSGHVGNFNKAEPNTAMGYGVPYDFRSVMHYSNMAFSSNNKPTIIPKDPAKNKKMGQRDGFSKGDIIKINAMYNCPEKSSAVTGALTSSATTTNKNEKESSNPLVQAAQSLLSLFIKK